jgi:hypothetical protein
MSKVSNKFLAQAPANTLKGNSTGSTANIADLTIAQVLTMLGRKSANTTIGSAATSVTVTFSNSFAYSSATAFTVTATMINTIDANPQYIPVTITATSTTGFVAKWNAPTPTANYILSWQAALIN